MTSIPLRTLVRDPKKVRRMTQTGKPVKVTHNGKPLWILQPAKENEADEAARKREAEEIFAEVLRERPSKISAVKLLEQSRR